MKMKYLIPYAMHVLRRVLMPVYKMGNQYSQ